jgi:hypothetical protein
MSYGYFFPKGEKSQNGASLRGSKQKFTLFVMALFSTAHHCGYELS